MGKMTIALVVAASLLAGASAQAGAPLCRDLKGMFTPCPPGTTPRVSAHGRHPGKTAAAGSPTASDAEDASPAETGRVAKPGKPGKPHRELFARGHLCRDSKGLFTPCPK